MLLKRLFPAYRGNWELSETLDETGVSRGRFWRPTRAWRCAGRRPAGRSPARHKGVAFRCWYPGWDLNPHAASAAKDFKSFVSADFTTRACRFSVCQMSGSAADQASGGAGQRVHGNGAVGFVCRDGGLLLENVAQFVNAFEQAVLRERVYGEFHRTAVGQRQRLRGEVDGQLRLRVG